MEEKRAAEDAAEGEPMPKRARAADASASPAAAPLSLSFLKPGSNIQLADVQDLVLNTLIGTPEPSWVRLHKAEGAEVARVMVVMLCGLDHSLWSEQCDSLPCLRERFEPPVRVYGVAANATTTQSVVAFMQCKQPYAHQRRKDADKTDPTKRKSTAAVQRASQGPGGRRARSRRLHAPASHARRRGQDRAHALPALLLPGAPAAAPAPRRADGGRCCS